MPGEFIISSVLSHHSKKFEVMDGPVLTSVTAQFYLASKEKYILKVWGRADPKKQREERHVAQFWLLFLYVFSPPPEPALCKLG